MRLPAAIPRHTSYIKHHTHAQWPTHMRQCLLSVTQPASRDMYCTHMHPVASACLPTQALLEPLVTASVQHIQQTAASVTPLAVTLLAQDRNVKAMGLGTGHFSWRRQGTGGVWLENKSKRKQAQEAKTSSIK